MDSWATDTVSNQGVDNQFCRNLLITSEIINELKSLISGSQFGTVIALLLSGALADGLGWEWVFYFFGILGTAWCVAWLFICHDSPEKHPTISEVSETYSCTM